MGHFLWATTPLPIGIVLTTDFAYLSIDPYLYYHMVGILIYLTNTHLDLFFAIGLVNCSLQDPREDHL